MKYHVTIVILFIISNLFAQSPTDSVKQLMRQYYQFSRQYPQEKVYLHFDNTAYFLGETIWYKAYVVTAEEHTFTNLSRVLYVELLNPEGEVVETQKLRIENGQCHGQFRLKDSLFAGYYEVRAYTRYMLNFCREEAVCYIGDPETKKMQDEDDGYKAYFKKKYGDELGFRSYLGHHYVNNIWNSGIFSRVITIYNRPQEAGNYAIKTMRERPRTNKTALLKEEPKAPLTLSFYPEGGQLIYGNASRVAFIATNGQGEQVDVTGNVNNQSRQPVDTIVSVHAGMGVFHFTPDGNKFTARVWYKSHPYSFEVPSGIFNGCSMTVNNLQSNNVYLQIQGSSNYAGKSLGISVTCRGKVCFFGAVTLNENTPLEVSIPKAKLTTGVNQITLFSARGEILSQRLIFVDRGDYQQNHLQVSGKKTFYQPYEPVQLNLQLHDTTNNTKNSCFSLAVRDAATEDITYHTDNILTNLLLSSELKGYIADPAYYFESDDNIHRKALDLLLMTQAWCRYNWKQMAGVDSFRLKEPLEKGILIDGILRKVNNDIDTRMAGYKLDTLGSNSIDQYLNRVENTSIKMDIIQSDSTQRQGTCITNNKGVFSILAGEWYGNANLTMRLSAISPIQSNRSKDEYIFTLNRYFSPVPKYPYCYYETNIPYKSATIETENSKPLAFAKEDQKIAEVTIKARKISRTKIDYRYPNFVIDINKIADCCQDKYYIKNFSMRGVFVPLLSYLKLGDVSISMINEDGSPITSIQVDYDSIKVYTDLIMRNRFAIRTAERTCLPDVVVMAIKSKQPPRISKLNGIRFTSFQGYTQSAEFYHPDYSTRPLPELKDYRRTLYWNPDVHTDSTGKASVQFYNNSTYKQIHISAEGVTSNGIPVVGSEK